KHDGLASEASTRFDSRSLHELRTITRIKPPGSQDRRLLEAVAEHHGGIVARSSGWWSPLLDRFCSAVARADRRKEKRRHSNVELPRMLTLPEFDGHLSPCCRRGVGARARCGGDGRDSASVLFAVASPEHASAFSSRRATRCTSTSSSMTSSSAL